MKKIITIILALAIFSFLLGCVAEDQVDDLPIIIDDTIPPVDDTPDIVDEVVDTDDDIVIEEELEETIIDEDDDIDVGEMF